MSDIGCLLPQALQLGGTNGPFDFQYVVDVTFQPEGNRVRRFGNLWLSYLDDFAVRSGRWFRGGPVTDAAYDRLLADAKPPERPQRSFGDALDAAGFTAEPVDRSDPASAMIALSKGRGKGSIASTDGDGPRPGRRPRKVERQPHQSGQALSVANRTNAEGRRKGGQGAK